MFREGCPVFIEILYTNIELFFQASNLIVLYGRVKIANKFLFFLRQVFHGSIESSFNHCPVCGRLNRNRAICVTIIKKLASRNTLKLKFEWW